VKWTSVLAKNLKLLFRNKESAFTIIFGPLLIILLVSAAYTGGNETAQIRIGTYAPEYTPLADQMITALKAKGHLVSVYDNLTDCTAPIAAGRLHTCIEFPPDFRIKENGSNEVVFAVDYSRINLVYQIIEELSHQFQLQGATISKSLTGDLLSRTALAQRELHTQLAESDILDQELTNVSTILGFGKAKLSGIRGDINVTDLKQIRGNVNRLAGLVTGLKAEAHVALDRAVDTLNVVDDEVENATRDRVDDTIAYLRHNASDNIDRIAAEAPDAVEQVSAVIDDAARRMQELHDEYAAAVAASSAANERIGEALTTLSAAQTRLTTFRGKLQHLDQSLQQVLGLSAGSVATPITTRIEPVNSAGGNLTFTYPYILLLIIMFLGLMLNSSLIVMDKTSTAAFRNFTTATRDEYHLFLSFVTTFLILLAQTLVILLVSYFFVRAPLFHNFGVSLLLITLAITLFSFLGMIVGYLSTTQEAAMIASLSIGSIFLFISNLILPLEAMNRVVSLLSAYNPYVVLSELLKQSILFDLHLSAIPGKIALLTLAILLSVAVVLAIQRSFRTKFFRRRSRDLAPTAFTAQRDVRPLTLGSRTVRNLFDLLEALDAMTRAEFEALDAASIGAWIRKELGEKRLARKLATRSKERMIIVLDKHLKRLTRKLQRQR